MFPADVANRIVVLLLKRFAGVGTEIHITDELVAEANKEKPVLYFEQREKYLMLKLLPREKAKLLQKQGVEMRSVPEKTNNG